MVPCHGEGMIQINNDSFESEFHFLNALTSCCSMQERGCRRLVSHYRQTRPITAKALLLPEKLEEGFEKDGRTTKPTSLARCHGRWNDRYNRQKKTGASFTPRSQQPEDGASRTTESGSFSHSRVLWRVDGVGAGCGFLLQMGLHGSGWMRTTTPSSNLAVGVLLSMIGVPINGLIVLISLTDKNMDAGKAFAWTVAHLGVLFTIFRHQDGSSGHVHTMAPRRPWRVLRRCCRHRRGQQYVNALFGTTRCPSGHSSHS